MQTISKDQIVGKTLKEKFLDKGFNKKYKLILLISQ